MKNKYMFRVAAINALGLSEFSDSEVLSFQPYTGKSCKIHMTVLTVNLEHDDYLNGVVSDSGQYYY